MSLQNPMTTSVDQTTPDIAEETCETASLTYGLSEGNEDSFRQFHELYFSRLLRYLIVVTRGDEQAARDALQETYLRVVRHGKRFDDEEAFWSWLTVLARCAARDGGRRQQRYRHLISRYFQFRNTDSIHEAEPTSKDPEQVLEDRVHDSLARMDPSERSLLESKYFEGASVRDLARQLSLSEKAVESKLTRARKKLKSMVLNQMRQPNET